MEEKVQKIGAEASSGTASQSLSLKQTILRLQLCLSSLQFSGMYTENGHQLTPFNTNSKVGFIDRQGRSVRTVAGYEKPEEANKAHLHSLVVPLPLCAQLLGEGLVSCEVRSSRLLKARVSRPRVITRLVPQLTIHPRNGIPGFEPGGW